MVDEGILLTIITPFFGHQEIVVLKAGRGIDIVDPVTIHTADQKTSTIGVIA